MRLFNHPQPKCLPPERPLEVVVAAINEQLQTQVDLQPPGTLEQLRARISEVDPQWLAYALAEIRKEQ